jgi:hypothetical protein
MQRRHDCDVITKPGLGSGFIDVADCDAWTCAFEQVDEAARQASVKRTARSKPAMCY